MWLISLIQGFISSIGNLFTSLFSLKSSVGRPSSTVTRWLIRILLVVVVLVVCYLLSLPPAIGFLEKQGFNYYKLLEIFGIKDNETSQRLFLPVLWLLFCAIVWILWAIFSNPYAPVTSNYPEIDKAWFRGLDALARAGKDIRDLPLFVVVGLGNRDVENFFKTCHIGNIVTCPEYGQTDALHFYAHQEVTANGEHREALFIVLVDACATSLQVERAPVVAARNIQFQNAGGHDETLKPNAVAKVLQAPPPVTSRIPVLSDRELTQADGKLAHVCDLLRTFRSPWCPVNGTLLALPLDWSAGLDRQDLLKAPRQDLTLLHRELEMMFPISVVFTGMEKLTGFDQFFKRVKNINPILPHSNAGSRFPSGNEIDDKMMGRLLNRGLDWFQGWIYKCFLAGMEDQDNQHLYRFLCQLDERRLRLVRILTLTLGNLGLDQPARLIGVYFAASGDSDDNRGFLSGVMGRLIGAENEVAWSAQAFARDRWNVRIGLFCYWLAGVLLFVEVLWVVLLWLR